MKHVRGNQAEELARDPDTFVLDVRTPQEFKAIALEKAVLIPIDQLAQRLDELPANKDSSILIYCAHGVRSLHGAALLEKNGFTNITNLQGGIAGLYGEK